MNLTFKGFLRKYCRELVGAETDNLKKLLAIVLEDSPAAAETLMVFAASQGKANYLAELSRGTWLEESYLEAAKTIGNAPDLVLFLTSEKTPDRYAKVWLAYRAKKEAILADRRVISIMREKTLAAMAESGQTAYSLCKQLGLNRGNVYAYLNAGDVTKVSRATARRIMEAACVA